jgi:predicted ATPase
MRLETISIHNYKSLQNVKINQIPRFMVMVGANGTGKSSFFDVFGFLRDALNGSVRQALDARGRYGEVVTRGHEGEPIKIELQVRMPIRDRERLVTYGLEIGQEKGRRWY